MVMRLRLAGRVRRQRPTARPATAACSGFGLGARTIRATAAMMIPPPTSVRQPSGSPRTTVRAARRRPGSRTRRCRRATSARSGAATCTTVKAIERAERRRGRRARATTRARRPRPRTTTARRSRRRRRRGSRRRRASASPAETSGRDGCGACREYSEPIAQASELKTSTIAARRSRPAPPGATSRPTPAKPTTSPVTTTRARRWP